MPRYFFLFVVLLFVTACGSEDKPADLPQADDVVQPITIEWTPPTGDTYEDAMVAYDQARDSKIGEHPGYQFAGDIWEVKAKEGHAPSKFHLGLLHYLGNGGREFNHNLSAENINQAAAEGYPLAIAFTALINENGDGSLFLKDPKVALENWQRAAEGGHCGALKRLKKAYADGELGLKADPAKVAEIDAQLPDCSNR